MPRFSIVIPTLERPHHLRHALESAIDQRGFSDYEIIVSANGDPKGTLEVVQSMPSDKVRFAEVGRRADFFNSWHFAARQSRGEYVIMIADDDCLFPDALARIEASLRAYDDPEYLSLVNGWYGHPGVKAPRLNAVRFDNEWCQEGPRPPIEFVKFSFRLARATFSPTYAAINRRIFDVFAERDINPYGPLFPDYFMEVAALSLARSACLTRHPVVLHGYAPDSAGENSFGPREDLHWGMPDGETKHFRCSPVSAHVYVNGWVETLLRAREVVTELKDFAVDWRRFFRLYTDTLRREALWRDVTGDAMELFGVLERLGDEADDVVKEGSEVLFLLRELQLHLDNRTWEYFEMGLQEEWIAGDEHSFSTIREAAGRSRAIISQRDRQAERVQQLRDASRRKPAA